MRISFIIPTRNQARFLRRCIDSCISQDIADSEIIVVDGLSADGTREILESYGDRIQWMSEADSGQAQAVNKGVARSRGELIAWINSDDSYDGPHALRSALGVFEADPALEIVYGDATIVDERGEVIRPYRNREYARSTELLLSPIGPSQPATIFRSDLFRRVGGLREDLHWALDYEFFLRMFRAARGFRYLPVTLAHTTFHRDAKSIRAMLPQIREVARLKREHAKLLQLRPFEQARLWLGIAELYAYWAAVQLGLKRVI